MWVFFPIMSFFPKGLTHLQTCCRIQILRQSMKNVSCCFCLFIARWMWSFIAWSIAVCCLQMTTHSHYISRGNGCNCFCWAVEIFPSGRMHCDHMIRSYQHWQNHLSFSSDFGWLSTYVLRVSFVYSLNIYISFCLFVFLLWCIFFFLQVVEDGYEFFAKRQLVTLFSAPNYCGEFDNAGGMMSVDESLMCSFQVLKEIDHSFNWVKGIISHLCAFRVQPLFIAQNIRMLGGSSMCPPKRVERFFHLWNCKWNLIVLNKFTLWCLYLTMVNTVQCPETSLTCNIKEQLGV